MLKIKVDEMISYCMKAVPAGDDPWGLEYRLRCWKNAEEVLVWRNGLTAADIALLREQKEIIHLLKPLSPSVNDSTPVSFEALDFTGAASFEEAQQELYRRFAAELVEREKEAARATYLCAWLDVASVDELGEELNRRIAAEKGTLEDEAPRKTTKPAYLCEILGAPPGTQSSSWRREVDRRIVALEGALKDAAVEGKVVEDEGVREEGVEDNASRETNSSYVLLRIIKD